MVAPLHGVRVLEVANMIAAPAAGALLADLGATVVKVEPPSGDILRSKAPRPEGAPDPWFELDNRGKRGLAVDLGRPEGVDVIHRLATRADVFLTNLTPARQRRFELAAADIHRVAPTVIHASLTGYGTAGPDADRLAYDMTAFFARGGVQSLIAEPGGPPPAFRPGQGDHTSSLSILSAVLAALRLRDLTGQGQTVEVALLHVAAWTIASDLSATLVTRQDPVRYRRDHWPTPMTCRFRCADDRWIALCMPGPKDFFPAFARCLGHPEWVEDPRFATPEARLDHAPALLARCDEAFGSRRRAVWADRMDDHGLTWAPVQTPTELVADPQVEALGIMAPIEDHPGGSFRTVAAPFAIRSADVAVRGRAPGIGEHSREVLTGAGFSPAEIDGLTADGVIGDGRRNDGTSTG